MEEGIDEEIFICGKFPIEIDLLGDNTDDLPNRLSFLQNIITGNCGTPSIRAGESRKHADCSAFPCPVGSQESKDFPLFNPHRDAIHCPNGTVGFGQVL